MIHIRAPEASALAICARLLDQVLEFKVSPVYAKGTGNYTGEMRISTETTKAALDHMMSWDIDESTGFLPLNSGDLEWTVQ